MAMGQAAGMAASLAVEQGIVVRDVDPLDIQRLMRKHGADPGDVPSANAGVASPDSLESEVEQ